MCDWFGSPPSLATVFEDFSLTQLSLLGIKAGFSVPTAFTSSRRQAFLFLLPLRMAVPQSLVLELCFLSLGSSQIILPSRGCRMLILSISNACK